MFDLLTAVVFLLIVLAIIAAVFYFKDASNLPWKNWDLPWRKRPEVKPDPPANDGMSR